MSKKSLTSDPGFFGELWQQAKLVFQLFLDPKVPIYLKVLPIAAVAYLLFPVDLITDFVPGLGQLDDLTILLIASKAFIDMAPKDIVNRYLGRLDRSGFSPDDLNAKGAAPDADSDIIEGIIIEEEDKGEDSSSTL
ncbi:MAG: YkvA family protein [Candidatus Promineifilaceae bacterium]